MAKKIQMMSHDKEWQVVDGVETLVPVEQFDIDPITDSSCVKIEGFRTLEETLNEKNMFTPEVNATKVMDKVGGEYHQNVVDGAYEEAILYGNTQVNLCEEDTSVALQIPTTFTSFNNGELQINNKENQVVAPLIKGVTMVNLAQTNSASLASSESVAIENVKGNTLYTLSFKFTTKNTNSGVTIESYNGDTYLENTMHKTGLGDEVKFTFTTHANATVVKVVNNAAYGGETIQLDEIMLIEGDQTALDVPFFKGMKSVELVRPLTNLFTNDTSINKHNTTVTNSNGTVTVTSTTISQWASAIYHLDLKPNTKYVIMWDDLTFTQTASGIDYIISVCENNTIFSHMGNKFTTLRSIIFNTGNKNLSDINLRIHATTSNSETGKTTVTGLRVFEYDDYLRSVDLQSIGWFSGTKNVAAEPIKTCSKNLYPYGDISFTPTSTGWFDAKGNGNMYGDIAQKSKCRFLLRKGTYKLSSDYYNRTNLGYMSLVTDKEEIIGDTTFTLDKDTYLTLRLQPVEANVPTTLTNIQIERGNAVTDYVAHDSRYYEPNGQNTIVLRSLPGGVCDTFNLQTGEYTRRINEIVLDGGEDWRLSTRFSSTYNSYYFVLNETFRENIKYANDKYQLLLGEDLGKNIGLHMGRDYNNIAPFISSDKMTLSEFKEYLQQNPVTVQYELATPITTIIPRTIKQNKNGTVSTVDFKTYTNKESLVLPKNPSYLTINSMTSIKPVVEPITYFDFKTRLKANTDYTIKLNKETNAVVTTNLGGTSVVFNTGDTQKLVKTPSINLEQNLRISGSGSIQNIMVIEGNVLGKELPYFNGMCNVKMPIVRNTGKNLFDVHANNSISLYMGSSNLIINNNKVQWNVTNWNQGIILRVKTYGNDKLRLNFKENTDLIGKTTSVNGRPNFYEVRAFNRNKEELGKPTMNIGSHSSRLIENIPKNCDYIAIYAKTNAQQSGLEGFQDLTITNVDNGNICEPYRGNDICIAQGEIGLTQDMFEQGGFSTKSGSTYEAMKYDSTIRLRSKSLIRVKPNTTYYIKNNLPQTYFNIYQWNENIEFMQGTSKTNNTSELLFTTTNDTHYIHFLFSKAGDKTITVSEFDWSFFQLLELDSTVQLRSLPNGVKDELNLLTGEYIQRVGEVVLDGSDDEDWKMENSLYYISKNSLTGQIGLKGDDIVRQNEIMSDKLFDTTYSVIDNNPREGLLTYAYGWRIIPFGIEVTQENLSVFKTWLQQNPITVQYQLKEPIISYPRIVSNTQEREVGIKLPNGVCDTYNPSTGITVKRVGKVILDGSENWLIDAGYTPTANLIRMSIKQPDKKLQYNNGDLVCDKLPVVQQGVVPCIYDRWNEYLYVDVKSSDIGVTFGTDNNATIISKFKTWLNANPITVYYELKYPQVTTDIVLPNGVHDEYNPITGLYTKRVGCIELDGSNDERWSPTLGTGNSTHCYASISIDGTISPEMKHMADNDEVYIMSNSYETVARSNYSYDKEQMYVWSVRTVYLNILQSKLSTIDMAGFRTYLSQNPIKLWYELQTPQKIQLTPYFGLPMPYAYQDGNLIMDSAYNGVTLPPEFKYRLIANRTGQVNQNNIKLQQHTSKLSNLEAMLVEATLQSMYEREMMAFNLEMVNINLINLEE